MVDALELPGLGCWAGRRSRCDDKGLVLADGVIPCWALGGLRDELVLWMGPSAGRADRLEPVRTRATQVHRYCNRAPEGSSAEEFKRRVIWALIEPFLGRALDEPSRRTSAEEVERHRGREPYKFNVAGRLTNERPSASPAERP